MILSDESLPVEADGAARFWRARAERLAARTQDLEARLLALADRLPLRYARLLVRSPEEILRTADWPDPLAGWKETTAFEPASVATDLPQLWTRLDPSSTR
jgi:hypothetical protein